jgi:hypothetical protein
MMMAIIFIVSFGLGMVPIKFNVFFENLATHACLLMMCAADEE